HARRVRSFETVDHLQDGCDGVNDWQRPMPFQTVVQRAAASEFHGDGGHAVNLLAAVDVNDIRMVHGGGEAALAQKALAVLFASEGVAHDFQGNAAAARDVFALVDLAH